MMEFVAMKVAMMDWFDIEDRDSYFIREDDIDHCTTERILRNKFYDPLASSESEDDTPNNINWDAIFKNNKQKQKLKSYVPCVRPVPSYPRLSELKPHQHIQFLKIVNLEYPNVLKDLYLGKPTKNDFKEFEAIKETYLKEQEAYKEWAKSLWVTDHCIRALRPKPAVERVYEAEFKVKAQRMQALPKRYDVAAHLTLSSQIKNDWDLVLKEDLIKVTLEEMPQVQIPNKIVEEFNIITPCTVPEPCQKHPYQIVLPNEEALSMLPITEIHRELASFAVDHDTQYIASENALKCLTQWNRHWLLPLSVCDTMGPDGKTVNVMVLDSEFSVHKEAAHMRTYKAFRHLLENALIPSSEREKIHAISRSSVKRKEVLAPSKLKMPAKTIVQDVDMSSDDEDNQLFIDTGDDLDIIGPKFLGFTPPKVNLNSPLHSPKAGFSPPAANLRSPKAGLASPAANLRSPKAGFASPAANLRSPKAGLASPAVDIWSPKAGFDPPAANLRSPKAGLASPAADIRSPKTGFAFSAADIRSPKSGFASPDADIRSAKAGFNSSASNLRSPKVDIASPNASLFSPQAGYASPNACLVSPATSFGSPNSSFGSPPAKKSMRGKTEAIPRRSARLSSQESTGNLSIAANSEPSEESPAVSSRIGRKAASRTSSEECSIVTDRYLTKAASRKISDEYPVVPDIGLYTCTCKGTLYEKPPRRSFRKWQFRREDTHEMRDIIIHSPHKAKDKTEELIIEPLPEYQIDLGASEQSPDAVRSAALSLALREEACLLNVRVDGPTGEVVTFEKLSKEAFAEKHPDVTRQVISTINTVLSQLQELRPGHYVLQHEPSHGPNAMLMCPRSPQQRHSLQLNFDSAQLIEVDESHLAKVPPTISTALLPYHKHRRVLPCAFTPYENHVAKEKKKPPPSKKKAPPQALKFPKRRRKKNNKW